MRVVDAALAAGIIAFLAPWPGRAEPPAPAAETRLCTPEDVGSDLDAMYRRLQLDAFDLNAFTPKPDLDRTYQQLRAGLAASDRPMSRFEVQTQLQLLAAAAHQGHARVDGASAAWADYRKGGGRAFPLSVRIVDGRVYVARNLSGIARIRPGDEILTINGAPASQWLERTRRHVSAETPALADSILDYDFPIYLWVEAGPQTAFQVSVKPSDAAAFELQLPAQTAGEMAANEAGQPAALDLDHPMRDARILANGVGYLRPGPFYNEEAKTGADEWDVTAFRKFIDTSFRMFNAHGVHKLIIDLRGNPGGDSLFSDVMVSWFADRPYQFFSSFKVRVSSDAVAANRDRIEHDAAAAGPISQRFAALYAGAEPGSVVEFTLPASAPNPTERFHGKVFALIDRQSYSNTVAVAATIQDYHFGLVIGEPTADMATAYGAMEQFTLPATGIVVGFPKARIVRPNGDPRSRGVTPDIAIPFPVVETSKDEVLQRASAIAAGRD